MIMLVLCMVSQCHAGWLAAGAGGGVVAYTSCMGACMGGAASGSLMASVMTLGIAAPAAAGVSLFGAAACATACSSLAGGTAFCLGPACFSDNTTMLVNRNGSSTMVSVQQLETGMLVETFDADHGTQKWVEVMSLVRDESEFRHVRVTLDGLSKPLTVTAEHLTPRARSDARLELVTAAELKVADFIPIYQSGRLELARVQDVEHLVLPHRNVLVTRDGTVVADGVLTTTVCDGEFGIKAEERGNYTEAMRGWREIHEPKFKSM